MIDHRAIVASKKIAADVEIGPFSIIGEEVEIGPGTWIGPHVVITGHTVIGARNRIYQFCSIGESPQHKKYEGEPTKLIIGDDNVFRESCTVHVGTIQGHEVTVIGHRNMFMVGSHIAHDCVIGNDVIFSNCSTLAGHVNVGNNVVFGGFTKVAQFTNVGDFAFLIGDTHLNKDVLPYIIAGGPKDTVFGLNLVGLRRGGFSVDLLAKLKEAYNIILRRNLSVEEAIAELEVKVIECPEIVNFLEILRTSKRGILR